MAENSLPPIRFNSTNMTPEQAQRVMEIEYLRLKALARAREDYATKLAQIEEDYVRALTRLGLNPEEIAERMDRHDDR